MPAEGTLNCLIMYYLALSCIIHNPCLASSGASNHQRRRLGLTLAPFLRLSVRLTCSGHSAVPFCRSLPSWPLMAPVPSLAKDIPLYREAGFDVQARRCLPSESSSKDVQIFPETSHDWSASGNRGVSEGARTVSSCPRPSPRTPAGSFNGTPVKNALVMVKTVASVSKIDGSLEALLALEVQESAGA